MSPLRQGFRLITGFALATLIAGCLTSETITRATFKGPAQPEQALSDIRLLVGRQLHVPQSSQTGTQILSVSEVKSVDTDGITYVVAMIGRPISEEVLHQARKVRTTYIKTTVLDRIPFSQVQKITVTSNADSRRINFHTKQMGIVGQIDIGDLNDNDRTRVLAGLVSLCPNLK